jgi:hypothetical protein
VGRSRAIHLVRRFRAIGISREADTSRRRFWPSIKPASVNFAKNANMMRCIARRLLQAANAIDTSGLLRTRRERPSSRRAADKRNEFASSHRPAPQTGGSYPTMLWAALCITAYSGCRCPLWVRSGHHSTSKQCLLCLQERTSELPGFVRRSSSGSLAPAAIPRAALHGFKPHLQIIRGRELWRGATC